MGKILLTLAGIVAIWYLFRYVSRRAELKGREAERRDTSFQRPDRPADPVDDTRQCTVCGAYVVVGRASNCGRTDCPY